MKDNNTRWPATPLPASTQVGNGLLGLLQSGAITLEGMLPWSSNSTFLGRVTDGEQEALIVYKPIRGERPLWDFPRGTLALREVAAYIISQGLRWDFVPPTVLRDGPHGNGAVQLFVEVDQEAHFFTFHQDPLYFCALQQMALFDVIVNNADRKGGHCLGAGGGRVWAIDHGVCFNVEPKLRTVIWDFAGQPIPVELTADLARLQSDLSKADCLTLRQLSALLASKEISAVRLRLSSLLAAGRFPEPPEDRRPFPWPLV